MLPRIAAFLLRPFAKPIRYGALKIMRRFGAPNDGRPVIAASAHLVNEVILPSVFRLFRDEQFRNLARFSKLPTAEHDRIWNELVAAGMLTLTVCLDAMPSLVRPEHFQFWRRVQEHAPKQFQRELMGYGVASASAKLMRELIGIRHEEYAQLARRARDLNEIQNAPFRELSDDMRHVAAGIQAIAIGAAGHITRGTLASGDPLIGFLVRQLHTLHRALSRFVARL